jgi:hypothetical protein
MSLSEKEEANEKLSLKKAMALIILYRAIYPAAVAGAAQARGACAARVRAVLAGAAVSGAARARSACATRVRNAAAVGAVSGAASARDACATRVRAAFPCAAVATVAGAAISALRTGRSKLRLRP